MSEPEKTLKSHMARGAVWMVSMRLVLKMMGFVNVIILARLLVPEDFGLVAVAMILIGLVATVTDGSFDKFVLKNPEAGDQVFNTAWTAQVFAGLLATVLIFCLSPLLVSYASDDPRLYSILFVAGLRPAILGFENIGQVEFRRDFNFGKEFRYWVYRQSIGIVIGLTLAITLQNYMALAWAAALTALSTVIISYVMSQYRPRFTLVGMRSVLSFSKWFALLDAGRYMADRLDEFIVAGLASPTTVGHYYMASDLSTMPTRELILPLERALMPTLAHIGDDKAALGRSLETVLSATIAFCAAAGMGLYAIADIFIRIVLGAQWIPAVPFFEWLAIYGALAAIVVSLQPFFVIGNALRTYSTAYLGYLAILAVTLTIAGLQFGVEAIAPVRTFCMLALLGFILAVVVRLRFLSLSFLLSSSWRPLVSAFVMLFLLRFVQGALPDPSILNLLVQIIIGGSSFVVVQLLCWRISGRPPGVEGLVLDTIQRKRLGGAPFA